MRRCLLVLASVGIVVLSAGAGTADAQSAPPAWKIGDAWGTLGPDGFTNRERYNLLFRGIAPGGDPADAAYVAEVKARISSMETVATSHPDPVVRAKTRSGLKALQKLRIRFGMLPKLRTLGTLSLGPTAFSVGWKIGLPTGEAIYKHLNGDIGSDEEGTEFGGSTQYKARAKKLHWMGPSTAGTTFEEQPSILCTQRYGGCEEEYEVELEYASRSGCPGACSLWSAWTSVGPFPRVGQWQDSIGSFTSAMRGADAFTVEEAVPASSPGCGSSTPCIRRIALEDDLGEQLDNFQTPEPWTDQPVDVTTTAPTPTEFTSGEETATKTVVDEFTTADDEKVLEAIGDPAADQSPFQDALVVPSCLGITAAACAALLEADGWYGEVVSDVVPPASADLDYPASTVIGQVPAEGATIEPDGELLVSVNPDAEAMPVEVFSPEPGETYAAYVARLVASGWVGTATVTELSEASGKPSLGPDAPVSVSFQPVGSPTTTTIVRPTTWPAPAPRIAKDTPITFTKNPPGYAPVPTGGGGTPGVDMTPITDIDFGCRFPYGFLCYAVALTEVFDVTPDAPRFEFSLGTDAVGHADYNVDLNVMDDYMSLIRSLIAVALWVGGVYFLATNLLGFRMGGDPGEAADEGLRF